MSKHSSPIYPGDLPECKCGQFIDSKRRAYSNGQKKFYAVCDNCNGICDENFIFEKIQEGKRKGKKS
jgi:hypothetical protein